MPTPIADMVAYMLAAGVAADMVVLAIRTVEQSADSRPTSADSRLEQRRAKDREYRRKTRENKDNSAKEEAEKAFAESRFVSADSADSRALTILPSLLSVSPNKENQQGKRKKEIKTASLCPDEFRPTAGNFALGLKLGFTEDDVVSACDEMRNWSHANAHRPNAKKSNWGAALANWLTRAHRDGRGSTKPPNQHSIGQTAERYLHAGLQLAPKPGTQFDRDRERERGVLPSRDQPALRLLSQG